MTQSHILGVSKKMTVSEAKEMVEQCGLNIKDPTHKEVLKIVVEALEKRTAKKPIEKFPFHHCPSCNTVVSEHNKFCSECGQKLDWSDTE